MIDGSARKALHDALGPLLPEEWRIIPYSRNIDAYTAPIVMLKQESFEHHPTTPSHHLVEFTITIATAYTDVEKAEDDLDDNLSLVLHRFDTLGLSWDSAKKRLFDDQHLCYDITAHIETKKKKDDTP